ncbi:hypothetical protein EYF80_018711 [Liparis tanakae]|uniref:Uncharacterized protein n=1 Tax=Liparis tanakae TaxID=230148 RepID=A0A4Z2HZS3_9TELE|nr:hypothetical protein EYF80_018711 [Liparis tanakae]
MAWCCDGANPLASRRPLAAVADNDGGAFVSGGLLRRHAEVRGHVVVGGDRAGGGAVAPQALWFVEVLQSVPGQGVGSMLVQVGPRVDVGVVEGRSRGGGIRARTRAAKRVVQRQRKGRQVCVEVVFGLVEALRTWTAEPGQGGGTRSRADHLTQTSARHGLQRQGPLKVLGGEARSGALGQPVGRPQRDARRALAQLEPTFFLLDHLLRDPDQSLDLAGFLRDAAVVVRLEPVPRVAGRAAVGRADHAVLVPVAPPCKEHAMTTTCGQNFLTCFHTKQLFQTSGCSRPPRRAYGRVPTVDPVQVLVLTVVAVDGRAVGRAAVAPLLVLRGALAQRQHRPRGAPPCVPARGRSSEIVAARLTAAPVAALALAVCVAVAAVVVMVLFGQAVAERAGVGELPVHTGGVRALALLQQLRGGGVGERAAAPRTVLKDCGKAFNKHPAEGKPTNQIHGEIKGYVWLKQARRRSRDVSKWEFISRFKCSADLAADRRV